MFKCSVKGVNRGVEKKKVFKKVLERVEKTETRIEMKGFTLMYPPPQEEERKREY